MNAVRPAEKLREREPDPHDFAGREMEGAPFSVLNSVRKKPRWKPKGASNASSAAQASTVSHRTSTSSSTYMNAVWSPAHQTDGVKIRPEYYAETSCSFCILSVED